ncbi:HSP70E [Auxenochlorella protothecoides x Auxenochlorella symbiontica]
MSVAGIDVGDSTSCVALARKGGVDVILNKESNRETPSVLTFNAKQRQLGTDAVGAMATNPRNTVSQVKRLLGKKFSDPAIQADLQYLPYKVVEGADGGCEVEVQYLGAATRLSPEQLMAALLVDLRQLAEREQGAPVTDAVLAVPVYFTEAERHAMLAAAGTAGLKCLRLLNDTTATALAWGIYRTDLPEDTPVNVVFIDVGYSATQVCVVALRGRELKVLSSAWDRDLGGRNFDNVLFEHFVREFDAKYKLDIKGNLRASFRLRGACEKAKKILTTNPEAVVSVECIADDKDVAGSITREVFEEEAKATLDKLVQTVRKAVEDAGLTPETVSNVEFVGGSSRVPAVTRHVTDYFGREPNRTLNATETVSRGCALQCAMLSPAFKVRDFQVQDTFPYGIQLSWQKEGERVTSTVFERGSHVPSAKMLTFYRTEPFDIEAAYTPESDLPSTADARIGSFKIGPFAVPAGAESAKLKVKVTLNLNSVLVLESVVAVEEEEVEEEAAAPAPAPAPAAAAAETGDAPMEEAGAEAGAPAPGPAPPVEKAKKKRVRKTAVAHSEATTARSEADLARLYEAEAEMALQARVQEETNDAKNAVEAYIYGLRNALRGSHAAFETEARVTSILAALEDAENWLYEEGEEESRGVYVAKLAELRALGEGAERRAREAAEAPVAAAALRAAAQRRAEQAASGEERYAHIGGEERERLAAEAAATLAWLEEKERAGRGLTPADDPVLTAGDCVRKGETLERVAAAFDRPAPPKPKAPAAAEEDKAAPPAGEAMDTDAPGAGGAEAQDAEAQGAGAEAGAAEAPAPDAMQE